MEMDGSAQLGFSLKSAENPDLIHIWPDGTNMGRIGKKAAGRRLDGREWSEMPKVARRDKMTTARAALSEITAISGGPIRRIALDARDKMEKN